MTKTELKEKLKQLRMSQKDFAEYAGCSYQSVKQWKEHNVPYWVTIVIEHIEVFQAARNIICKNKLKVINGK